MQREPNRRWWATTLNAKRLSPIDEDQGETPKAVMLPYIDPEESGVNKTE